MPARHNCSLTMRAQVSREIVECQTKIPDSGQCEPFDSSAAGDCCADLYVSCVLLHMCMSSYMYVLHMCMSSYMCVLHMCMSSYMYVVPVLSVMYIRVYAIAQTDQASAPAVGAVSGG